MTDLSTPMPPGTSPARQPDPSPAQQASEAADAAKHAAGNVTQTATDNAKDVVDEARRQARDLVGEARDQVSGQVEVQHRNLVSNLHTLADELGRMSDAPDHQGLASELVGQAGERARSAADWLGTRQPGDLLDEVRSFARRRPGAFLVGALVAGVTVGRLTRGVVAAHTDDDSAGANAVGNGGPRADSPNGAPTQVHQGLPTAADRSVYGSAATGEITSGMPSSDVRPPNTLPNTPAGTFSRPPEPPPAAGPGTVPA